jgi:tetratricopeptide (TPR) repeat protein
MGQHHTVLTPAKKAVSLYRRFTQIDPDRYRPELARALTHLGVSLSKLDRYPDALPHSQETVAIYRDLVEIDRRKYSPLLARALRHLAVDYSGLNRHADADRCRQEADSLDPPKAA